MASQGGCCITVFRTSHTDIWAFQQAGSLLFVMLFSMLAMEHIIQLERESAGSVSMPFFAQVACIATRKLASHSAPGCYTLLLLQVCDFNLSRMIMDGRLLINSGNPNSPGWQAPEMLSGELRSCDTLLTTQPVRNCRLFVDNRHASRHNDLFNSLSHVHVLRVVQVLTSHE